MKKDSMLSNHAREFVYELRHVIEHWHDQPLLADLGTGSTRARLLGFASAMIRLLDSADDRGWDVRDIACQIVVGDGDEEHDEGRVDTILSSPIEDDLDRQLDRARCENWEPDDVARPVYDGTQYLGAKPSGGGLLN